MIMTTWEEEWERWQKSTPQLVLAILPGIERITLRLPPDTLAPLRVMSQSGAWYRRESYEAKPDECVAIYELELP